MNDRKQGGVAWAREALARPDEPGGALPLPSARSGSDEDEPDPDEPDSDDEEELCSRDPAPLGVAAAGGTSGATTGPPLKSNQMERCPGRQNKNMLTLE